jgi:large subunit ribosomal protein L15
LFSKGAIISEAASPLQPTEVKRMFDMELNQITDNKGARKLRTRLGRGIGSGKGKTCARGHKGQKSRSGVAVKGFEGGQMPIYRRLPKRGFNNINRVENQPVNLGHIQKFIDEKKIDAKKPITPEVLLAVGLINRLSQPVKLLCKGELKAKIELTVCKASASAIAAVEKAGGKLTVTAAPAAKEDAKAAE